MIWLLFLIPLALFAFWFWMFLDMTNNDYLSHETRLNWTIAFIILNIFTAIYYYSTEYKPRH